MRLAVEIEVRKTGNGFEIVNAGLKEIRTNSDGAAAGLDNVNRRMQGGQGLASALGNELESLVTNFGRFAALAAALAPFAAMAKGVQVGVEFNALLETSQIGLASIIAQTTELTDAEGRRLSGIEEFNEAQSISVDLQRDLKMAALETAATYEELLSGLQAVMSTHKGAFNTDQIVQFTKELSQAAAAIDPMLLKEGQFAQEIRGVMEGDLSRASRLARIIFNDFQGSADDLRKKLDELRKEGKLFDFLHERLAAFAIGGEKSMDTLTTASSNFKDFLTQAFGEGTQDLTRDLAEALNSIVEEFTYIDEAGKRAFDQDLVEAIKSVADVISDVVLSIRDFVIWLKEAKDVAKEFMRDTPREIFDNQTDRLNAMKRELEMGSWTASERKHREEEIAKLEAGLAKLWKEIVPTTSGGQKMAADFLKQTAGGARLEGFDLPHNQGQRLLDLANKDAKLYLATLREIKKASKDGLLTYLEFAQAFEKGRRELKAPRKIGGDDDRADPDAARKAAEAERQREEAVRRSYDALKALAGQQEQALSVARQSINLLDSETNVLRLRNELEEAATVITGTRLDALQRQIELRSRLTAAERDRAGVEALQRATAEEYRHLDALARIADMQARLNAEQEEFKNTLGKKGISPQEAERQQELINRALLNEDQQYATNRQVLEKQSQAALTAIDLKAARERNQLILQEWQELNRHMLALYDDLTNAVVDGAHDTVRAFFEGTDLLRGFESLLEGIRSAWANMLADMLGAWFTALRQRAVGTPDMVDEYGRLWKGMEPDKRAQGIYAGISGAAALYGLIQSGQAGATPGQNAISGMSQGAMIGSVGGVPGAVIGLIIGGVFGALTGKEKAGFRVTAVNGKLTVTGGGSATDADVQDALRGINIVIANTRLQMFELLEAFPTELMHSLLGQMAEVTDNDLFGNFDIGKQRWKNWLAKQFGSLGKAMRGMLSPEDLKRWTEVELPNMMFDAYAPIIEAGLRELGVTQNKINELLSKGPGFDAKEALQKLRDYVEVLVGLIDSEEFNKLSSADLMNRAVAEIGETPIAAIRRLGQEMKDLSVGFDDLTTDEQVRRGRQILELDQQRQQAVLQYLYRIKQAQDALFKSIDAQVAEIDLDQMGPFEQLAALQGRMADISAKILTAATPDELSALGSEYQQLVGRVYELSMRLPKEINTLIDAFEGLDELLAPEKSPMQRLIDLQGKMDAAYQRMMEATNPDEQVAAARELYDLTAEKYQLERQMLKEIGTVLETINAMLDETIRNFQVEAAVTALGPDASPEQVANIRIADLMARQRELRDRLQTATSAQEINDIVAEMNRNANTLFNLMGRTPEAAAQLTAMLEDVRRIAQEKLKALAEAIAADDEKNRTRISTAIGTLETALAKIPAAADAAKTALDNLRELLRTRFTELTTEVIEANRDLLATIGSILETLRNGLDDIFNPDPGPTPGPGTGKPDDGEDRGVYAQQTANAYAPPEAATQPTNIVVVAEMGDPAIYVNLSGSAEAFIEQINAHVDARARQVAAYTAAVRSGQRSGL